MRKGMEGRERKRKINVFFQIIINKNEGRLWNKALDTL